MRRVRYPLLYLLLVIAIAVAFGSGRVRLGDDSLETSVVWGGRVLDSPAEVSSWLAARGVTYEEWARKHPAAAARIELRGHPAHVALKWPPAIHGELPPRPAAVARVWDAVATGRGVAAAAVAVALMLGAAVAGRRRLARGVERIRRVGAGAAVSAPPG